MDSLLIQPEIDEIFLIDDGSSDRSLQLCLALAEKHPTIKLLQHPGGINKGAPASRNLGLQQVKNQWVQFMDADDELLPGKIADQLACIQGDEALVIGKFTIYDKDRVEEMLPFRDTWSGLISTRLGINVSNLWNADWIRRVGGWDETLPNMQEYFLMFEILKRQGKFVFSEGLLTKIFSQVNSITNSLEKRDQKRDNYFLFREQVKDHLVSTGQYTLKRRHYYEVCTGKMLRYHQPSFPVKSNRMYFSLYSKLRKILS